MIRPPRDLDRSSFPPVMRVLDDEARRELEDKLGHRFTDETLLDQAFTHASFANQGEAQGGRPEDYDRLEFLGDAVIGMLHAERALRAAPAAGSGELTVRRARLARLSSLAAAADALHLGAYVRISEGEARQGGTRRRRLLADLFEAVVGALYLDGGLEPARAFVDRCLPARASSGVAAGAEADDPKSTLQERLQAEGRKAPTYSVLEIGGPPHSPIFLVEVEIDGRGAGRGLGGSRREAEREAARAALAAAAKHGSL